MDQTAQPNFKKIGIIAFLFLFFFIPLYFFGISLTKPNAIENLKVNFGLVTEENSKNNFQANKEDSDSDSSTLYFIDLEYDPVQNTVAKIASGKSGGDVDALDTNPSSSSAVFNYKIEAISSENQLLASGWVSLYKTAISTSNGKYRFRVSISYSPNSKLIIYSKDKKLWEERII